MFRLTRVSDSGNTVFARKCIQRAEVENNNIFFRQLRQSILRGGGGGGEGREVVGTKRNFITILL